MLAQLNILFIHHYFPVQLRLLVPAQASQGHSIKALTLHEVIEHDVSGKLVDFFAQAVCVQSISDLLDDMHQPEKLSAAAREMARNNSDLKNCLPAAPT